MRPFVFKYINIRRLTSLHVRRPAATNKDCELAFVVELCISDDDRLEIAIIGEILIEATTRQ